MRFLAVVLLALACVGCEEKNGENADGVVGPGIDVHCAGLTPLGDTNVKVTCAPQEARVQ